MMVWLWKQLSDTGPEVEISGRALRRFPEAEVDRLLRSRVLIERRKADTWPVCRHCDCGYDARPVRSIDDTIRACCPHDVAEDEFLEPEDLLRFGIDADRVACELAASGGLSGGRGRVADGIWVLGATASGRRIVLCADQHLLDAPGAIMAIRAAAGTTSITVIATEIGMNLGLRLHEAGIEARVLADCVVVDGAGTERLRVDRLVPVVAAPRLVLSRGLRSAVLDDRPLDLAPQMFALFRLLAEHSHQRDPVLRKETIEAETSRPANQIMRDLRRALVRCSLTEEAADALVQTVHGRGYRLGLTPGEVQVQD